MSCHICGSGCVRKAFVVGPYDIVRCRHCGFGWCEPFPTEAELAAYYTGYHPEMVVDADQSHRMKIMANIRLLRPQARRVLDVGCGFGHLLDCARAAGFETYGCDLDQQRVAAASARGHRVTVTVAEARALAGSNFDVITLSHVIEHVPRPLELLAQLHDGLSSRGLLFVACPNFAGFHAQLTRSQYGLLTPPEHINYFTVDSLQRAAAKAGFRRLRCDLYTHALHVKAMLASLVYLRFLRQRHYVVPGSESRGRFIEGRCRTLRRAAYSAILLAAHALRPAVNRLGGEHIECYWTPGS